MTKQSTPTISELVENVLSILQIIDRKIGNRPEQIATLRQTIINYMADFAERITPGIALAEPLDTDKEWAEYEGFKKAVDLITQNVKAELGAAPINSKEDL